MKIKVTHMFGRYLKAAALHVNHARQISMNLNDVFSLFLKLECCKTSLKSNVNHQFFTGPLSAVIEMLLIDVLAASWHRSVLCWLEVLVRLRRRSEERERRRNLSGDH